MTIARLGTFTPTGGGAVAPGTPSNFVVPAAGIPAGAMIILAGYCAKAINPSDSKGNTWVTRAPGGGATGQVYADCKVVNALVNGDTINPGFTASTWELVCFWYSACVFEAFAAAPNPAWTGTAAVAPTVTTAGIGDLVLGFFDVYSNSSPAPVLSAVGAGYTDEVGTSAVSGIDQVYRGLDWVSKIGSAPGPETPSGTITNTGFYRYAMAAAYWEPIPNQMVGVV